MEVSGLADKYGISRLRELCLEGIEKQLKAEHGVVVHGAFTPCDRAFLER